MNCSLEEKLYEGEGVEAVSININSDIVKHVEIFEKIPK